MRKKLNTIDRGNYYGLNFSTPKFISGDLASKFFFEASNIENIKLNPDSGFSVRKGRTYRNTTPLGDYPHSLGWFEDYAGNASLIVGGGGNIYADPSGQGNPVASYSGLTADIPASMLDFGQNLFHVNGTDGNLKFDGTNWYRMGVAAPAAAPGVASSGVGAFSGEYLYCYVYVHKNATTGYETLSKISPLTTLTVANVAQFNVSVVASADPQVTHIRIYRESSVAVGLKQLVELANTTAVYPDTTPDASMTTNIEFPLEGEPLDKNGTSVVLSGVCQWKSRLWGWSGQYLYSTREGRPERFFNSSSTEFQPVLVDSQSNQNIIAAIPFRNCIVVWTSSKMFLITGDAEPFVRSEYLVRCGCVAWRSAVVCAGRLMWLSSNGVYSWDGESMPVNVSEQINRDFEKKGRGIFDTVSTSLQYACGVYFDSEDEYRLSLPRGSDRFNSRTFIYDFALARKTSLSPWSYYTTAFSDAIVVPDLRLLVAKPNTGYYLTENIGDTDEGATTINGFYETRHWDFGVGAYDKRFFFVHISSYVINGTGCFKTIVDDSYTDPLYFSMTGSLWNAAKWAESGASPLGKWAEMRIKTMTQSYPQECCGSKIGFRIELQGGSIFHSFEVQYGLAGRMLG